MTLEIALLLGQIFLKYGPEVYQVWKRILSKTTVTVEDFAALDVLLEKTGASYFK